MAFKAMKKITVKACFGGFFKMVDTKQPPNFAVATCVFPQQKQTLSHKENVELFLGRGGYFLNWLT